MTTNIRDVLKYIHEYNTRNHIDNLRNDLMNVLKLIDTACRVIYNQKLFSKDIPALTYATLTSLIPVMAVMFACARGFGLDAAFTQWLTSIFQNQPLIAEKIIGFVQNYLDNTSNQTIIIVGFGAMCYTLYSLMTKIEHSFNGIWKVQENRTTWKVICDYTAIFVFFWVMILLSSSLNVMTVYIRDSVHNIEMMGDIAPLLLNGIAVIPLMLFFIVIYWFVPNTYVQFRKVLIPSILASIAINGLQYLYLYVQIYLSSYNIIYGSLAVLPLFILWLQLSWTICITGVVMCYSSQNRHHYDCGIEFKSLSHEEQLKTSAIVLGLICQRFKNGEGAYTPYELQEETQYPQQIVNSILAKLKTAGLIYERNPRRTGLQEEVNSFAPARDTDEITFGYMIAKLESEPHSTQIEITDDMGNHPEWTKILELRKLYIAEGQKIHLSAIREANPNESHRHD